MEGKTVEEKRPIEDVDVCFDENGRLKNCSAKERSRQEKKREKRDQKERNRWYALAKREVVCLEKAAAERQKPQ